MSNNVQLTSELRPSKISSGGFDRRNSKIDIKEICQKFENLSSAVSENPVPVPPVRRKKSNSYIANINSSHMSHNKLRPVSSNGVKLSTEVKDFAQSSVKERTKLFESTTSSDETFLNAFSTKSDKINNKTLENCTYRDNFTKVNENSDVMNTNTPPAKPPRSFLHTDLNNKNVLSEKLEVYGKNSTSVKDLSNSDHSSLNSVDINSSEYSIKSSRLGSSSEILTANGEKSYHLTPKISKSAGKIHLKNYLKNISSTANNIREKLKQSSIFVDLTPTTVSPPKHYGTLKKSMSEEHIYAELSSPKKSPISEDESKSSVEPPLHYMCTSLVPPAIPSRGKTEETSSVSNLSVRNMIYGSFASLRASKNENSGSVTGSPASDSIEADLSVKAIQDRIIYVKSVRKQASSSSLCLAPKLYEALFIVNIVDDQPQIAHSFPLKVDAEYSIPLLPHICFPDSRLFKSVSVYQNEVFYFSLTDKNENIFGYCLRIQGWPEAGSNNSPLCVKLPVAICILSSFSAPVFYRKLLFEIEKHLTLPRNNCFKYIRSLRKLGVPNAGASLSIPDISENNDESKRIVITRSLDSHFVGFEMTRALQLLDVDILVKCVASLFLERRILLFSALTSNLYHCSKAISSLLYPFEWPHQIVPVLPACLTIHCCSEQPYILGIVNKNCDSVLELLAEHELLIIDVDKGAIIRSCNDEDTILPRKVQKAVISALNLAKNMTDPTEMLRDIMISEAFVHMSVEIIGHYENHFTEIKGNVAFQKDSFLKNAYSCNIRCFLQWFSETQMFDSFIEESLWRIKYRDICQTQLRTFFEKRVDEYKWELSHDNEKLSRIIGKTVRNFGEILKGLKKC